MYFTTKYLLEGFHQTYVIGFGTNDWIETVVNITH